MADKEFINQIINNSSDFYSDKNNLNVISTKPENLISFFNEKLPENFINKNFYNSSTFFKEKISDLNKFNLSSFKDTESFNFIQGSLQKIINSEFQKDLFSSVEIREALKTLLLKGTAEEINAELKRFTQQTTIDVPRKIQIDKINELKACILGVYQRNQENIDRIVANTNNLEKIVSSITDVDSGDKSAQAISTLAMELLSSRQELVKAINQDTKVDVDELLKGAYALLKKGGPFKDAAESLIQDIYTYELGEVEKEAYLLLLNSTDNSALSLNDYLNQCKKRPSVGNFKYVEQFKERYQTLLDFQKSFQFFEKTPGILKAIFREKNVLKATQLIDSSFNTETEADIALLFYEILLENLKRDQPKSVNGNGVIFLESVSNIKQVELKIADLKKKIDPEYEFNERLERNLPAFYFLSQQFREAIVPLFQSLVAQCSPDEISDVFGKSLNGSTNREKFIIRVKALEEQRELSEIEKDYLASVELLSSFNPHLIALLRRFPGETSVYIENYMKKMSEDTFDRLEDGQYVKLVQIGKGPNGVASAGEIVRKRPDLASDCLYLDAAEQTGGPFAIPKGPAWNLNSASSYSESTINMPDSGKVAEEKTVRAFGSSLRWYPGERARNESVRQGSINQSVDYLPSPDNIAVGRYPDNEVEALLLQLCDVLLTRKQSFNTKVVGRELVDDEKDGNTLLTIQKTYENGEVQTKKIRTDNIIISSGLGEDYFGFELKNTRAETLLKDSDNQERFPRLSSTLNGFKALANRNKRKPEPGETLVIYGNGNSCDTLLEYISAQFEKDNKFFRNIRKIYIVTTGELSQRPRYAGNTDVFARNGNGNLVEFISARVTDVGYKDDNRSPDEDLVLYKKGESGSEEIICDTKGNPVQANSVIAATGFRSSLISDLNIDKNDLIDVTLPTNPNISIAQTLKSAPNTIIIGTGSNSGFNSLEKLLQIPETAMEALLRNGAENAVAKGFRGPDVQAAVRTFIEKIPVSKDSMPTKGDSRERVPISVKGQEYLNTVAIKQENERPVPQNNVEDVSGLLSAMLVQSFPKLIVENEEIVSERDHSVEIEVEYKNNEFTFQTPSEDLKRLLSDILSNSYFQTYALEAMEDRRNSNKIKIALNFRYGRLDTRNTFVEAI